MDVFSEFWDSVDYTLTQAMQLVRKGEPLTAARTYASLLPFRVNVYGEEVEELVERIRQSPDTHTEGVLREFARAGLQLQ